MFSLLMLYPFRCSLYSLYLMLYPFFIFSLPDAIPLSMSSLADDIPLLYVLPADAPLIYLLCTNLYPFYTFSRLMLNSSTCSFY